MGNRLGRMEGSGRLCCPPLCSARTEREHPFVSVVRQLLSAGSPCDRPPPCCAQVQEATANLSANLAREHNVCMTFMRDAFAYALTPHQARPRQRAGAAQEMYACRVMCASPPGFGSNPWPLLTAASPSPFPSPLCTA